MKIVIDGNDGTGKSTLTKLLQLLGYEVQDRGLPTKLTDDLKMGLSEAELRSVPTNPDTIYLILDAPIEICQERLREAGRDLEERYHTVKDLTHYRNRFLEVAKKLPRCVVIDASGPQGEVLYLAVQAIEKI